MKYLIILLINLMMTHSLWADEVCLAYTEDESVIVGMDLVKEGPSAKLNILFDRYLNYAKKNKTESLVKLFSRIDGSSELLAKRLKEDPDLYALYSGIKSVEQGNVFRWGQYYLMQSEYTHQDGKLNLIDAFYCSGMCQVSSLLDVPEGPSFLVSRFMYVFDSSKVVDCPVVADFSIYPKVKQKDDYPLKVYLSSDLKRLNKQLEDGDVNKFSRNIQACYKQVVEFEHDIAGDDQHNDAAWERVVSNEIENCSTNLNAKRLIPVVELSKEPETVYMVPTSFLGLLRDALSVNKIMQLKDGEWSVTVTLVERDGGSSYIVVFPIKKIGGQDYFDWKYFGTGSGELLTSSYLGEFVNARLAKAAKK